MSRKHFLAHNIRKFRKEYKLSQEELAKRVGITFSTLTKLESGVNDNPTLETLRKIAKVFNVGLDDLVGRK
jgi:transcriptional regulator with XRE-family HTH domain